MVEEEVRGEIVRQLWNTEKNYSVRILMAVESGSRAWGFASPNSDYDVRFIYVHTKDWYLSVDLEERRDVIEYPIVDEIDLSGWDVRKSLQLFWKSNPTFIEWVNSPITYINIGSFRNEVLALLPKIYSVDRGIQHYRSMARKNYQSHLRGNRVAPKKYLYVLRSLLAVKWLELHGTPATIEFNKVLPMLEDVTLIEAINDLVAQKRISDEKTLVPTIPVLNQFIKAELTRLEMASPKRPDRSLEITPLNDLFHSVLYE